jgi:hypothetical protein
VRQYFQESSDQGKTWTDWFRRLLLAHLSVPATRPISRGETPRSFRTPRHSEAG